MSEYDTLVLSGGSISGITLLGGLQYLSDNNIIDSITNYISTSVGAIICYLLIIGYTPIEIIVCLCINYKFFEKLKCFNIVNASRGEGATSFLYISEQLEKMTIEKIGKLITMKDIYPMFNKKFTCITYNMTKSKCEELSEETYPDLPCLTALRMTCNLPLIFETYKYGDSFYVDGGVTNNFPIDIAEKIGKKVLGICLGYNIKEDNPCINLMEYVYKLMLVPIAQSVQYRIKNKKDHVDVIEIEMMDSVKFFNFDIDSKTKLEMFSIGYEKLKKYYLKK